MSREARQEARLEVAIGYHFADAALRARALTHSSCGGAHNERLEFLGDAVLQLVITDALYRRHPEAGEGVLTRMRARLVARPALVETARLWSLADHIRVSKGERAAGGGPKSESVVADAVEAVLGAIYLDGGIEAARAVIHRAWSERIDAAGGGTVVDAKSALQEWTQQRGLGLPDYRAEDCGVGRVPRFVARCLLDGVVLGEGSGARKKEAEQQAAAAALRRLRQQETR